MSIDTIGMAGLIAVSIAAIAYVAKPSPISQFNNWAEIEKVRLRRNLADSLTRTN